MKKRTKTHFEARLRRNVTRKVYGANKTYKKGTVIDTFEETTFNYITKKNISNYSDLCICEGHGVYEYFDVKDIEIIKVEKITTTKETNVNLK